MLKERLRVEVLEKRRLMAFEDVYEASVRVQEAFLGSEDYGRSSCMSLYSSFRNEVLTDEIFHAAAASGREVYYPRVVRGLSRHLEFFRVTHLGELSPGSYEIEEPCGGEIKGDPAVFDLVVVPGAAFDRKGGRLGYGKGYYDHALKGLGCRVVALAYDFQVIDGELPMEEHDVRVSAIVTESRIIRV
ncbi:MAG: 5-formyltetrahydrofolate cyclo-ligase [Deltaproteobacteria bacterium RBG_19FT_COMBO_58_16]|nr:MAG: 5-formyltetrahydrofolate cyclo-ligase [Deltaproteobacteria bacterium RBG_19FT_COMBO_58_16]